MGAGTNGVHESRPALRVLVLGYYDGATDGVIELGTDNVYRFDLTEEVHLVVGRAERTFTLRPLPANALDRIVAAIAPFHQEPRWPAWYPLWTFPTDADRDRTTAEVDGILNEARNPVGRLTTTDYWDFRSYRLDVNTPLAPAG